jgi:hypothetical protein
MFDIEVFVVVYAYSNVICLKVSFEEQKSDTVKQCFFILIIDCKEVYTSSYRNYEFKNVSLSKCDILA